MRAEVEVPAGIYAVKFGPATWKGIEVRSGETTTIEPGVMKVEVSYPGDADVVDGSDGARPGDTRVQLV